MSRSSRRVHRAAPPVLFALLACAPLLASPPALADHTNDDMQSARVLFNEGLALRESGDLPAAIEKFEAAFARGGTPIIALEIGRSHAMLGHLTRAREVLTGIERIRPKASESPRTAAAREEAREIAKDLGERIPSLVLRVAGDIASAEMSVDGQVVTAEQLARPLAVDPGHHVVVLRANGVEVRREVDLAERQTKVVELRPPPPPPPPGPRAGPPAREPPLVVRAPGAHIHPLVYSGVVVGAAGLALGVTAGVLTLAKTSALRSECSGGACGPSAHGDLSTANTASTLANIGFVVLGVSAAVAIVTYVVTRPRARPQAQAQAQVTRRPRLWAGVSGEGFAWDVR